VSLRFTAFITRISVKGQEPATSADWRLRGPTLCKGGAGMSNGFNLPAR
jgi:hypothetical protein